MSGISCILSMKRNESYTNPEQNYKRALSHTIGPFYKIESNYLPTPSSKIDKRSKYICSRSI